jgi:1,4-dihydroxy-2-naphthoate octaprenyltransferase
MSIATSTRRHIWVDLLLYPAHTLPIAAAPVMVGAALAARDHVFAPTAAVLAFLGSWLIHLAGLFTDTHELLRRHPRAVEHPDLTNALQDGTLTLAQIKVAIGACALFTIPIAICFLAVGGAWALVIGAVGALASFGYSTGPRPYTTFGIAEPIFFAMFGIVAVAGTYYAQLAWLAAAASLPAPSLASLPPAAFLVGMPVGALVTNIMLIDDLEDRHFDASKGWRTIAVCFGPTGSRLAYCLFSLLAYLAPLAFWTVGGFGAWALLPLATLPLALRILPVVLAHEDEPTLEPMTAKAAMLTFAYAAMLAAGIAAS